MEDYLKGFLRDNSVLAMITHDLKSPMNAILGASQLIKNDLTQNHPEVFQQLQSEIGLLLEAGQEMIASINQIMALSKSQAQDSMINPVEITDIDIEFHKLYGTFSHECLTKKITFNIQIEEVMPKLIWDMDKLRIHVFNNIISNAIRFTPENGRIDLNVRPVTVGVEIIISDTGPGIPEEIWGRVFHQYEQYPTAESKRLFSTSGLGLFNANYFTRQHGGSVQLIEPAQGMGATFKIQLPYKVAE